MNPDIPLVLEDHAKRLAEVIVPKLSGFDANGASMISAMLKMVAEEWDRAAARRVEENQAIRAIFIEAVPILTDPDLAGRLRTLAESKDDDLHIKALDAANDALRTELAHLHAHVETLEGDAARRIDDAIWAELKRSVERRRNGLANF